MRRLAWILCGLFALPAFAGVCPDQLSWECFDATFILLSRDPQGEFKGLCSAAALDPRTLITAGHCLENQVDGKGYWEVYADSFTPASVALQRIPSQNGVIHPLYQATPSHFRFDVAILKLDQPLPETLHFVPLATDPLSLRNGDTLHRIGFGLRPEGNLRNWFRVFYRFLEGPYGETVRTSDASGVLGDSGGPVYLHTPGEGLSLVAVHSSWKFSRDYDEYMSWSPHLAQLRNWIVPTMNGLEAEELIPDPIEPPSPVPAP
jgi:hypothetical protein